MNDRLSRQKIGDRIFFSSVTDRKFKHNRISVHFLAPLSRRTASDNAVVPFILRKGYRECPDFSRLNAKLCDLYGAVLDADVSKHGNHQILSVSIAGIDGRFAMEGEDVTVQCADLLASVVLDPNLADGIFPETDVELERNFLADTIQAEINDKRSYALSRCLQLMCEGRPASIRKYGDIESARAITSGSAASAYERLTRRMPVEILFVGCGDPASVGEKFRQRLSGLERRPEAILEEFQAPAPKREAEETVERMDLSQSKLVMGFWAGKPANPHKIAVLRMLSALYGGTPYSKLFRNVREKLSLCYYCAARYDRATGILMVDSGIEAQNKEKARDEILAQLDAIKQGNITDEELEETKLLLIHAVTSVKDSLPSLESWYLTQILSGSELTPDEDIRMLRQITRDEIIEAAQEIALDTVYFLTGNEG